MMPVSAAPASVGRTIGGGWVLCGIAKARPLCEVGGTDDDCARMCVCAGTIRTAETKCGAKDIV